MTPCFQADIFKNSKGRIDYWWECLFSIDKPETPPSEIVSQYNKIGAITFGASRV